jgi:SAM-dependent methyltransferase
MTEPEGQGQGNGIPSDIRTDIPHPARVYDYWLGGKDNFPADREMAEWVLKLTPETLDTVRANRQWMVRAIRFLCDAGIRQFLDIGAGLPTSPNTYEVAQSAAPEARVVSVDNDPMIFLHAEALTAKNGTIRVVQADMRDGAEVLAEAGELLDFTKPVALMFVGCLHHLPDSDDPVSLVARYLTALAPGSYLILSHATDEFAPERTHEASAGAAQRGAIWIPRGKDAILRMFNGLELLDPGLVLVSYWRPEGGVPDPNAARAWVYGGIARA